MSILLTITASKKQLVAGIPEYLTLSVNMPATIFYTLDGSDPTSESDITNDGIVYLPTDNLEVLFKAFAQSSTESTDIYEELFSQSHQMFSKRFAENDGISILPFGSEPVEYLSVNQNNDETQQTSIPFIDLEFKPSRRDKFKNYEGGTTSVPFVNFTLELISQDLAYQQKVSSPNNNNVEFDPTAGLIIIDGSSDEKLKSQVVKVINRPYGTMNTRSNFYNEHLRDSPTIFGNLVRYFVNNETGKMVFYYHDSRECRWIESHQNAKDDLRINPSAGLKNNYVFPWIEDPVMSRIF
jgi:hypothetical protein